MSIEKLKEQARRHEQKEEWRKALDQYKRAIQRLVEEDQPDIGLYNRVGDLFVRIGDLPQAVAHYEQAVDLYVEAELPNNAIAVCKKVIRNVPERYQIYLKMGQIRASQGFMPDARTNYLTYAERAAHAGEQDGSLEALIEFSGKAPDDIDMKLFLADQLVAAERVDQAVEQLTMAHQRLLFAGDHERADAVEARIRQVAPDADLSATPRTTPAFEPTPVSGVDDDGEIYAQFGEIDLGGVDETAAGAVESAHEEVAGAPAEDVATPTPDDGGFRIETFDTSPAEPSGTRGGSEPPGFEDDPDDDADAVALPLIDFGDPDAGPEDEADAASEGPDEAMAGAGVDAAPAASDEDWVVVSSADHAFADITSDEDREADDAAAAADAAADADEDAAVELPLLDVSHDDEAPFDLPLLDTDAADEEKAVDLPLLEADQDGEALDLPLIDGTGAEDDAPDEDPSGPVGGAWEDEAGAARIEETDPAAAPLRGEVEPEPLSPEELAARIAEHPDDVALRQRLVEVSYRTGDPGAQADAFLGLAGALRRSGQDAKARAAFQQVLQVDPTNEAALAGLSDQAAPPARPVKEVAAHEEYVDLGSMILGDAEEKTTRFVVAYEEPSGDEDADFAKMLSQFKNKVSQNLEADDVRAHHDLGTAYKEMGLLDEAIAEYQQALRASADHLPTYELMGQTFMEMGNPGQAVRSLERALRIDYDVEDDLVGIYYHLARAYEDTGQVDKALEFYDRVFSLDINFADVTERLRALR